MDKRRRENLIEDILQIVKSAGDSELITELLTNLKKLDDSRKVEVKHFGDLSVKDKAHIKKYIETSFPDAGAVTYHEDKDLLGGFQILYKDMKVDNSLKSKIHQVKNILNEQ